MIRFEVQENGNTYFAYYSKRRSNILPLYTKSLPVYNKNNQYFVQLFNNIDTGCEFVIQNLNTDFDFSEQLLVNFTNFKVKKNKLFIGYQIML